MPLYTFSPNTVTGTGSSSVTISGDVDNISQTSSFPSGSGNGVIVTGRYPVPSSGGRIVRAWTAGGLSSLNAFTIYDVIWTESLNTGTYNLTAPDFPSDRGSPTDVRVAVFIPSLSSSPGTITFLDSFGTSFNYTFPTITASTLHLVPAPEGAVGASKITQIVVSGGTPPFRYFLLKPKLVVSVDTYRSQKSLYRDTTLFSGVIYPNSYLLYTGNTWTGSATGDTDLTIEIR